MKLQQGQVWKQGDQYFRIVHLERLEVKYKAITDLANRQGTHHHVSKKEFCRLLKGATLLTRDEVRSASIQVSPDTSPPPHSGAFPPSEEDSAAAHTPTVTTATPPNS